jgi:hypothetical protein
MIGGAEESFGFGTLARQPEHGPIERMTQWSRIGNSNPLNRPKGVVTPGRLG